MRDVRHPLSRILTTVPGLELAYLFGSYATGSARPDSDIDGAVRFPEALTGERKMDLIERSADELGRPVDVVDLHEVPEPVTGEVKKGIRLWGTDTAHAQLLFRHGLNVADFLLLRQSTLEARRQAWIR